MLSELMFWEYFMIRELNHGSRNGGSRTIQPLDAAASSGKFYWNSFTTGPKPPPKGALHIVQSIASSFKWEYPLLSLRSSSSYLCLLPHLPVTSIPTFIFPSITSCRRQFLRKMWPIHLAFHLLISCRVFLFSLSLSNIYIYIYIYIYIR
jgi:hypothetical protein